MNSRKTGVYIHIPFCLKKCAYCDFVSYENVPCELKEKYVSAVISQMQKFKGEKVDTIYFGGGTPTTLKASQIKRLLDAAFDVFEVEKDAEITIECNPKTADREYFKKLKNYGINRLSIGVQSLNDDELSYLGRVHTAQEAKDCISDAFEAGFDNFSVDVMFGLKCQTLKSIKETLDGLLAFNPTHISCYSLIISEGTPFYEKGVEPIDEDLERKMQWFIVDYLKEKGYLRYEISNFAKDEKISRHNTKYWEMVPYIGLGAAASSYYNGERYENTADINEFIKKPHAKLNIEKLTKEDEMSEFMFLGLRKTEGVLFSEFYEKFGVEIEEKYDIRKNIELGLLIKEGDRLFLSQRGIDVSNTVFLDFV